MGGGGGSSPLECDREVQKEVCGVKFIVLVFSGWHFCLFFH